MEEVLSERKRKILQAIIKTYWQIHLHMQQ